MTHEASTFFITTPIYYVNDAPHIGHVYTTTVADILARYHRLRGEDAFLTTGTDEHSAKVSSRAGEQGLAAANWAEQNAREFRAAFDHLDIRYDDFIRTSEVRHRRCVERCFSQLLQSEQIYRGRFEGWYDPGQEEYVSESRAQAGKLRSPIDGRPLVRKSEENFFFRLSTYAATLESIIESDELRITPAERKNEVLGRIRAGLRDVPVSRQDASDWGIAVPNHPGQRIWVWIDALLNYLTVIDTNRRRGYWPPSLHLVGKEILWFHAVVWPALLLALRTRPGNEWLALPRRIHAHGHWVRDGEKMSKSRGNFVDRREIETWTRRFGMDAWRYFFAVAGPLGAGDVDFSAKRLADLYATDLANTVGNCSGRVLAMVEKFCGARVPVPEASSAVAAHLRQVARGSAAQVAEAVEAVDLERALGAALDLVRAVDATIQRTEPFQLAKDASNERQVATILYAALEALRIASLLLWPVLPHAMERLWARIGLSAPATIDDAAGRFAHGLAWGDLQPGRAVHGGEALFPRVGGAL